MKRYQQSNARPLRRTAPTDDTASTKQHVDPEHAMQQLRIHIYNQALQTLSIVRTLSDEAPTAHAARQEISDAMKVVRDALVEAGLDLIRPIVSELKRVALPTDTPIHDATSNASEALGYDI